MVRATCCKMWSLGHFLQLNLYSKRLAPFGLLKKDPTPAPSPHTAEFGFLGESNGQLTFLVIIS